MPAPTIRCEFCENHEMRRDAYAAHVKAKHMKEIATLILEELKEYEVNTINSYAQESSTKYMAIPSKMYQDAEYWFGVKPHFYIRESIEVPYDPTRPDTTLKAYPEDDELRQYLNREENLIAHRKFIGEVLQSISLLDFIAIGKNIKLRNPDVLNMKKELSTLRDRHAALEKSSKNEVENLQKERDMWKETADEKEFIADLRNELQSNRSYIRQLEKSSSLIREDMEHQKREFEERWSGLNQSRFAQERETDAREDALRSKITKQQADLEKAKVKVKEEAQKLFDKEREVKQKIKEKKTLEKAKAKKAAKKAKKLAEMSDSDSDSGSDSD